MIGQWFIDKVKEHLDAHQRLVITDTQGDGAFLLAYLPARRYMVLSAATPAEERRVREKGQIEEAAAIIESYMRKGKEDAPAFRTGSLLSEKPLLVV